MGSPNLQNRKSDLDIGIHSPAKPIRIRASWPLLYVAAWCSTSCILSVMMFWWPIFPYSPWHLATSSKVTMPCLPMNAEVSVARHSFELHAAPSPATIHALIPCLTLQKRQSKMAGALLFSRLLPNPSQCSHPHHPHHHSAVCPDHHLTWGHHLEVFLRPPLPIISAGEYSCQLLVIPYQTCRAKLENVVVVGSNKCVWVQLNSECCEFVSPKDWDPGSYNGDWKIRLVGEQLVLEMCVLV